MKEPDYSGLDAETLRAAALKMWRHSEALRERAVLAEAQAQSVKETNTMLKKVNHSQSGQIELLLKKITELTRELAQTSQRDEQLELDLQIHALNEQVAALNHEIFGSSSEKRHLDKKTQKKKRKQRGHGPTPQPNLEQKTLVHVLDEADCCCPGCGGDLRTMAEQFEESELISVLKSRYVVERHKQQKYRCGGCGHIDTALGPLKLIPGGRYDLSVAVQVAVAKYLDALPLERQVQRMKRRGLTVTSQTLWDQLCALYLLCLPTFLALHDYVLTGPILHVDESPWRVFGLGKRGASAKWWLWTATNAHGVVFKLVPTRGNAGAKALLKGYSGLVVADGYGVYKSLEYAASRKGPALLNPDEAEVLPDFQRVGCWMHARRGFVKAAKNVPEAVEMLDLIGELYAVEREAKLAAEGDVDQLVVERARLRAEKSQDIIDRIDLWRRTQAPIPKTQFANALGFLNNQWAPLTVFLNEPLVPIDNGEAERQIRGPVVGRKNFYGSQSELGTRVAEVLYTLLLSAKHVGVDPEAYLWAVTKAALENKGAVLLPDDYRKQVEQAASSQNV